MATPTVDEGVFYAVLEKLRDLRRWVTTTKGDPWAFRQAMITIMAIDTECALEAGIDTETLFAFDEAAEINAAEFIEEVNEP